MPEGKFEEGDTENKGERNEPKSKGNPLQSLLKKKVKIFGREIPMPIIILGALGIGIVIFTLIGKKGGGGSQTTDEEVTPLGENEPTPFGVSERAESGMQSGLEEFKADVGQTLPPVPQPFESLPALESFSPLPIPELPYAGGNNFAPLTPAENYPVSGNLPIETQPIVRDVLPDTFRGTPATSGLARNKIRAIASQTQPPNIRVPVKGATALRSAKASGRVQAIASRVRPPVIRTPPKRTTPAPTQTRNFFTQGRRPNTPVRRPSTLPPVRGTPQRGSGVIRRGGSPTRRPTRQPSRVRSIFTGGRR